MHIMLLVSLPNHSKIYASNTCRVCVFTSLTVPMVNLASSNCQMTLSVVNDCLYFIWYHILVGITETEGYGFRFIL